MALGLKVHRVCPVVPPQGTTPTSLPLTFFDTPWLRFHTVEYIFFYDHPNSTTTTSFFDSVVPTLKHSLSLTLQHFLPLAGNITWPHDSPHPTITYLPGDAVTFTVAESNADFNHLTSNLCEGEQRHPLVPHLNASHEKASILALQLTLFPKSGFSIAINRHHGALDGVSAMLFIKSWAFVCSNILKKQQPCSSSSVSVSLPENLTPFFDRSVITDPSGISEVYVKELLNRGGETNNRSLKISEPIRGGATKEDAVKGSFEFTPSHIKKLKQYAESKIGKNKAWLSSFSVTCAYMIACVVKVEQPVAKTLAFVFGVDCRHRMEPPVKPTYVGNCMVPYMAVADFDVDIGFINALIRISDVLSSLQGGVVNVAENWVSKFVSVLKSSRAFSTVGSPRFEVYGVDFGWGRPKKVDFPSADKFGGFSLFASRDHDGGIEIGLALNKAEMKALAQVFAKGLESLD